jgi:catechol 2,3-dioxygenase-like lactoylglutathione lyase family enzyme
MAEHEPLELTAWNHIGIRVTNRARSVAFYGLLGFAEVAYHEGPAVSILRNAAGLEINLIVNAVEVEDNVLMDRPDKYPGYTHASLRVASIEDTVVALHRLGIVISEGPVNLGGLALAVFVRDPDFNVVELTQILETA